MSQIHTELGLDPSRNYVQDANGDWLAIPDDQARTYSGALAVLFCQHISGVLDYDALMTATEELTQRIRDELAADAAGIVDAVDAALMAGAL